MDLPDRIREAIATGKLFEPFSARDLAEALADPEWPQSKVHSFLVRHCVGNLAASQILVERAHYGRYRLIYDGPREYVPLPTKFRRRIARSDRGEGPILPGDSKP